MYRYTLNYPGTAFSICANLCFQKFNSLYTEIEDSLYNVMQFLTLDFYYEKHTILNNSNDKLRRT